MKVVQLGEASYRGHSTALGLDLCWEDGQLRWYDPEIGRYLLTYGEATEGRLAAERERDAALERVRELEDQVRRLQAG